MAYTAYTQDGTYWTLRKRGQWFLVSRLESGTYEEVERYGWYRRAGAAATAVGALTYRVALQDATKLIRDGLQARLDEMGLGAIPNRTVRELKLRETPHRKMMGPNKASGLVSRLQMGARGRCAGILRGRTAL